MNLETALERLFHRNLHVVKLDLEPMQALMSRLGNPQDQFICLHVAGTNGKGSVSAMLASILREQGYRTALYTSPHLVRFNERIQVDGVSINDESLKALIDEIEQAAATLVSGGMRDVTFFEFTTALAFLYFMRSGVQIAVIETGMGGRLDATNIITPALSIITSIGFEHTAYLGTTLQEIAGEKAGIIKSGRPVIMGALPETAAYVIGERANRLKAPFRVASELVSVAIKSISLEGQTLDITGQNAAYGKVKSPLPGYHQAQNAAVVIAAAECLNNEIRIPVSEKAIKDGISKTYWPARGQLLQKDPPVILDGAHNVEAAGVLARWVGKVAGKKPLGMIVGFLSDKDPEAFIRCFGNRVHAIWVSPIQSDRAMPTEESVRRLARLSRPVCMAELDAAIVAAREWAVREHGMVLITGSLYLAGETLALQDKLHWLK
ncbi:MAG TPA: folylpolyglutamate synthase/dihydrofolate synthase family protein [Kiritimatiellia bacterium]|nr:folylpolyglutamate synthase/dihydrofolate synthase family protein [Kiritimatiellia bacterium]